MFKKHTKRIIVFLLLLICTLCISCAASASGYGATSQEIAKSMLTNSVEAGKVRLCVQASGDTDFVVEYWKSETKDIRNNAGIYCTRASFSMALSYIGIDCTPVHMEELGNVSVDGKYLAVLYNLNKELGTDIQMTTSVIEYSQQVFNDCYSLFDTDPSYSPIYIWGPYSYNGNSSTHAMIIVGKDPNNSNRYFVVDPSSASHSSNHVLWLDINPVTGQCINASIEKYKNLQIKCIWQWMNPDISKCPYGNVYPLATVKGNFTTTKTYNAKQYPYSTADTVMSVAKGSTVHVLRLVTNDFHNIWAEIDSVGDGVTRQGCSGYVCFSDVDTDEVFLTLKSLDFPFKLADAVYPSGILTQGSSFGLRGTVWNGSAPMLTVSAKVSGTESMTGTVYPGINATSVTLNEGTNNINSQMKFGSLHTGSYTYELLVQPGFTYSYNGKEYKLGAPQTLVTSSFTISSGSAVTTPPALQAPTQLVDVKGTFTATKTYNAMDYPYAAANALQSIAAGNAVHVVRLVTNSYGNIWAQIDKPCSGYVCFTDLTKPEDGVYLKLVSLDQGFVLSDVNDGYPSGTLTKGSSKGLRGIVSQGTAPMYSVSAEVYGAASMTGIVYPAISATSVSLTSSVNGAASINNQMTFGTLPAGSYTYEVWVQPGFTYNGTDYLLGSAQRLLSSSFSIVSPDAGSVVIVDPKYPSGDIIMGASSPVSGTVKVVNGAKQLLSIQATLYNVVGDMDLTQRDTVSINLSGSTVTSYDLLSSSINTRINTASLEQGFYCLIVTATYLDGNNQTASLNVIETSFQIMKEEVPPIGDITIPPVTTPPVTEAPVTTPPVTEAPVTTPPVTEAPVTTPPVTEAPVTTPPVTEAPVTTPPVTEAPVTTPPVTEAPVTTPPVTEMPTATPTATPASVTPPKTGDRTPVGLYATMLMFSLCGLWFFLRKKQKT